MKTKKTFLVYMLLCFALILTSVASTLALVTDEHSTNDAVIKFDEVSLYADNNGSKLSINVNNLLGNGEVLFDRALLDSEYLYVNPTNDTADCYIRFKLSYTLGNEELDEGNAEVLGYLNDLEYLYKGFEANNADGQDYGFTYQNGYYYLVTETTGEGKLLKVVTKDDYAKNFIMSERYVLNVNEEHIDAVIDLSNTHDLMLKVEVEAIQCFNLSNLVEDNIFDSNDIFNSNTEESLEVFYGNATLDDYEEAVSENYISKVGNGTEESPYLISTLKQLQTLASEVNAGDTKEGIYYKLTKNISLGSVENWTPIGNDQYAFGGNFNGNGYTISDMTITSTTNINNGFFGSVINNKIENLNLDKCNVTTSHQKGAIIVGNANTLTMKNCKVTNSSLKSTASLSGAFIGYSISSNIQYCVNYANVSGLNLSAGIVGQLHSGIIGYCVNYGQINGNSTNVGGVLGHASQNSEISYCINYAKVSSKDSHVGGVVGSVTATNILKCKNMAEVLSNAGHVAGIVGAVNQGTGRIEECCNYGKITVNNTTGYQHCSVGGIIGVPYGATIEKYCYNIADMEAFEPNNSSYKYYIGGINGGCNNSTLTTSYCFSKGGISLKNYQSSSYYGRAFFGGIMGVVSNTKAFNNCYAVVTHRTRNGNNLGLGISSSLTEAQHLLYGSRQGGSFSAPSGYNAIPSASVLNTGLTQDKLVFEDNAEKGHPTLIWETQFN